MKECRKCKETKDSDAFGKRKAMKDGLKSWCKSCECEDATERRHRDPERARAIDKKCKDKIRKENPGKLREYQRQWHSTNAERVSEYNKNRNKIPEVKERNRVLALRRARAAGIKPKEKMTRELKLEKARAWASERLKSMTPEEKARVAEYKKVWHRERKRNNIEYRLKCNYRKRVWDAVKGHCKSADTEALLGCSADELKAHLEAQFAEGMSFDNYGEWHVDHIKPCARFDLSIPSEQRKCFHFSNLQPLWAIDNWKKSDKYTENE